MTFHFEPRPKAEGRPTVAASEGGIGGVFRDPPE